MDSRSERLWQRGVAHFRQGNLDAAQAHFESFLAREPDSGPGRFRLSMVLARRGRHDAARALAEAVAQIDPDRPEVLAHLARCQLACGLVEPARASALRAMALPRGDAVMRDTLAVVLTRLDEQALALELFDEAIAQAPGQASLHFNRGFARAQYGMVDAAGQDLQACLALQPAHAKAHWSLSGLRRQDAAHREQLDRLHSIRRSPVDSEYIALSLFRARDAEGDLGGAWEALADAIATRAARTPQPDVPVDDVLSDAGDQHFLRPPPSAKPACTPIFVFGMPQSGVGLLGRLLSRHARVQHLGLVSVFPRLVSKALGRDTRAAFSRDDLSRLHTLDVDALGREYQQATGAAGGKSPLVCESRPMNYQLAGLIASALPGARMLHVRRDPLDTCLSLLAQPLGDVDVPTQSQQAVAAHYLAYRRLMQHWHAQLPGQIMDVDYESLVAKPDMVLRVVCSFLGIRYGASLRMGLSLDPRHVGCGRRYAAHLPQLEAGLAPLYLETRIA